MRMLPVVGREMGAIARRPSAYWVRSGAALAAFLAMGYVALIGATGLSTKTQGQSLFDILSLGAFAYCALVGIRGASDALSHEKRDGTLGLLFLTDLKGYDVVLGKFVSVSLTSIYGIFAVAPALAFAFLLGGTSPMQFLLMIVLLFNTLFLSMAMGIVVSTFSQHERPAMGGTLAVIFLVLVMPYAVATAHSFGVLEIWEVMLPGFLLTSPLFAFWTIKDAALLRMLFDDVLLSLAFAHAMGWLCLIVASASVAAQAHADAPRGRLVAWFLRLRQDWAYGKAERRRAIRRRLLDRNAFAWLAGRDRLKQRYAWIFLALLGALWFVARWKAPEVTEEWPIAMFSLWFLHLFFKVWVASEVAARFIEDRRSNALELILTTPLKLAEFASGQRLALVRQFGPPIALIILLNLVVGEKARDSSSHLFRASWPMGFFLAGLVHLAADLYTIHWVAIWRSLRLRGTNRTISQSIFLVVILPVVGWFFIWQGSWLAVAAAVTGVASLSASQILWSWTALCLLHNALLVYVARRAFFHDFREAATRSFDKPAPSRWKFWRRQKEAAAATLPTPRLRLNLARKIALVVGILLACCYGLVVMRRHRLETAAAARLAAVHASGLPSTPNAASRWRPSPARSQSASVTLRETNKLFVDSTRPPQILDSQFQWTSREAFNLELKQRAIVWLQDNAGLFRVLEKLPGQEAGGMLPDERSQFLIHVDDLTRGLQLKARLEIEDDPAAASKTILVMIHYARALQGESLGAMNSARYALRCVSDALQRVALQGNFSREDWRAWKVALGQLRPISVLRDHLILERVEGIETLSMPVDFLFQRFGRQFGDFPGLFNFSWFIRRFFGQDRAEVIEYLDHMEDSIANIEKPFWIVRQTPPRYRWRQPTPASPTFIAPQIMPAFDFLFWGATEGEALKRILMTAADIEIYRAENRKPPVELRVLSEPVPIDPFDGKPLRYVLRGDEYSLYSVGEDMADNGGASWSARRSGDVSFHCGKPPERKRGINNP